MLNSKEADAFSPKIDRVCETYVNPVFLCEDFPSRSDSTRVGFYMDAALVFMNDSCNSLMLANLLKWYKKSFVAVIHNDGLITGIVTRDYLEANRDSLRGRAVGEVVIPWQDVATIGIEESIEQAAKLCKNGRNRLIMVLQKERPVGVLWPEEIRRLSGYRRVKRPGGVSNAALRDIITRLPQSLLVLDKDFNIVYHNRQIFNLLPEAPDSLVGFSFEMVFGSLLAGDHAEFRKKVPVHEIAEHFSPKIDVETKTVTGSTFLADYYPIIGHEGLKYIVVNFRDITHRKDVETESLVAHDELAKAFRLMLPTTTIEKRLKAIPEYQDVFDHHTGLIEITGIIPDGAYRHVINCLRIASEFQEKGVFRIRGIDRDTVVQTLILHDLGKRQPKLMVGDIRDPRVCFGDGKIHAERSMKLAARYGFANREILDLILYHHHLEHELPANFPVRLLPMYRLICMIDGLSAGMTRRNAELEISVQKNVVTVYEKSSNSRYNGIREHDLISGEMGFIKTE